MTLCFLIKKRYLQEKLEEQQRTGSFIERREYKPYWRVRIGSTGVWSMLRRARAVFLCGQNAFDADVLKVELERTIPGIGDVVKTNVCYNIMCRFPPEELKALETFYQSSMEM